MNTRCYKIQLKGDYPPIFAETDFSAGNLPKYRVREFCDIWQRLHLGRQETILESFRLAHTSEKPEKILCFIHRKTKTHPNIPHLKQHEWIYIFRDKQISWNAKKRQYNDIRKENAQ